MRESVLICVDSGLNRQHIRGSESHAPPLPKLRPSSSATAPSNPNVIRQITYAYTLVLKERRDRNQRWITNGRPK
jgi:hypothetical protein